MTRAPRSLLVTLTLAACAEPGVDPEVAAVCAGDVAVQLIATASPARALEVHPARDSTMIAVSEDRGEATHLGPGCGAKAVRVLAGARVRPVAAGLDPSDDDPRFACLGRDLVELDLTGAAAPTRVLPHLDCDSAIRTPHGVVFQESHFDTTRSGWWHFPDFPAEASAAPMAESWLGRVGGDSFYASSGSALHAYELTTGATRVVLSDVFDFQVSATHVLWLGYESDPPTVELLELATGARRALGEFTKADGGYLSATFPGAPWSWNFDATGQYVLHVPPGTTDAPREAFDLQGNRLSLPLPGYVLELLPGGHVLSLDDTFAVFAARPGDAAETRLDIPAELGLGAFRILGDRIETVVADALYDVPLDGAPARLRAQDVGPVRVWLGERHLLTIFADELVAIDIETGARTVHHAHVSALALAPDASGLYFTVAGAPDDPDNGVWYLPEAAL